MIDLHCHSHISDGALPPEEVVALAAKNGCTMLALTDHDHTGGLAAARSAAQQHNIRFINGVEISVTWRGRTNTKAACSHCWRSCGRGASSAWKKSVRSLPNAALKARRLAHCR